MNKKTLDRKLREIERDLNWCNCCGERPELVSCPHCVTVCTVCSCKTLPLGRIETVLEKKHIPVRW